MYLNDSSADFSRRTMPAAHPSSGILHLYCIELILERTHVLARSRHWLSARVRRRQSSRPAAFAPAAATHVGPRRGASAGQAWQPSRPRASPGLSGQPRATAAPQPRDSALPACLPQSLPGAEAPSRPWQRPAGQAGPSPRLRRSRVRITPRSGSRRGAILSPGAAARLGFPPAGGSRLGPGRGAAAAEALPFPAGGRPGPADSAAQSPAGRRPGRRAGQEAAGLTKRLCARAGPPRSREEVATSSFLGGGGKRGASRRGQEKGAGGEGGRAVPQAGGLGFPAVRPTGAAARLFERPPAAGAARAAEQRDNMEETGERGRRGAVAGRPGGWGARAGGAGGRHSQEYGYSLKTVAWSYSRGAGATAGGRRSRTRRRKRRRRWRPRSCRRGFGGGGGAGKDHTAAAAGGRLCGRRRADAAAPGATLGAASRTSAPAPPLARVPDERRAQPIKGAIGASGAGARPREAGRRRGGRAREAEAAGGNRFVNGAGRGAPLGAAPGHPARPARSRRCRRPGRGAPGARRGCPGTGRGGLCPAGGAGSAAPGPPCAARGNAGWRSAGLAWV